MNKSVYFHVDEVTRDAVTASNLKRILARRGVELVYGSKTLTSRYLRRYAFAFDACILPKIAYYEYALPDPGKSFPPVVTLMTEGVGVISRAPELNAKNVLGTAFVHKGDPRWAERVAAQCVWGEAMARSVAENAPHLMAKTHVVGHPRHDARCIRPGNAAPRAPGKTRIGVISRLTAINPFDSRSMLDTILGTVKLPEYLQAEGRHAEDLMYIQSLDLRIVLELFQALDPERFEISVRPHPRENRATWEELRAKVSFPYSVAPWDQPFMHWLDSIDIPLGPSSTSFYDAIIFGKRPVCTNAVYPQRAEHELSFHDDTNPILAYAAKPGSFPALRDILRNGPEPLPRELPAELQRLLADETNYPHSARSLDKVADVVCGVLEASRPADPWRKKRLRLAYELHNWSMNRNQLRRNRRTGVIEQSGKYLVTPERVAWMDALAGEDGPEG